MEKTIVSQLIKIKGKIVSVLSLQRSRLSSRDNAVLTDLYNFIDKVICDKVHSKRYTVEEYVDSKLMEDSLLLKSSRNTEVKKIVKMLEEGIKW